MFNNDIFNLENHFIRITSLTDNHGLLEAYQVPMVYFLIVIFLGLN